METSLHRDLKAIYADAGARQEAALGQYRIDVLSDDQLIEVQVSSLAAIRPKIHGLLDNGHHVLIVKPITRRYKIIWRDAQRWSPARGDWLDVFPELVHFGNVLSRPNVSMELVLTDEAHLRRRVRNRRGYKLIDRRLLEVVDLRRFAMPSDWLQFIPNDLAEPFHTGQLAERLQVSTWMARTMTYSLKKMDAIRPTGKQRNWILYERTCKQAFNPTASRVA